jgi:hypothetical protein
MNTEERKMENEKNTNSNSNSKRKKKWKQIIINGITSQNN